MQRRHWLLTLASAALPLLSGCAGLGGPRVITLDEAELSRLVARAFPMNRRLLELLDLQLSAPRLQLLPDSNRLAVALAVAAEDRVFGGIGRGELAFDSALRWSPEDATLRLAQVRVRRIELMASGDPRGAAREPAFTLAGGARRIGQALAELVLEDLAVYRLSAERQQQLRRQGLQPGAVTVTARGVEITLASR